LGRDCDLATFELTQAELRELDRITVPWPPVIPAVGQVVLLAGVSGATKKSPAPGYIDLGYYTAFACVDSVSDRYISSVIPPSDGLLDVLGKGLPPDGYDLGGTSGGPVATLHEGRIVSWQLSGAICECHPTFNIVKAARADMIKADGAIDC